MNRILFGILFAITVPLLLGSAQEAYAAFLTIDDSVENQITLSHDPNWEGGVTSNGIVFAPSIPGVTVNPGEAASFVGQWIDLGQSTQAITTHYFTDACTGLVSDIITVDVDTDGFFGTLILQVQSSPDGGDLGPLPGGAVGIPEPSVPTVFDTEPFLQMNFVSDAEECAIGGELLSIDTTALILAGAQTFSWMIPVTLSVLGIGLFVFRKSKNS